MSVTARRRISFFLWPLAIVLAAALGASASSVSNAFTFFVPTASSTTQLEPVGYAGASGFQDLAVRSIGLGGPASGTTGTLSGPTGADLTFLAGGTRAAVLQAGSSATLTGGYLKAFSGGVDGSVACVPGSAVGTNLPGGPLTLQEGQGTGTGTGGGINFYTVPIGASGSGLNATALTSTLTGVQNNLSGTARVWRIFPTFADGGVTSSAGMQTLSVNPTINCTAASRTGNYVALAVSVNETSLPTGPNYLLLLQAGAVGATTKFSVDNTGAVLVGGTLTTANNAALAQGFTTGGLILPLCSTGAPSGAAANGNVVVGADNNLWCRINGAWVQVNGGATPTLGAVVNSGNTVNGTGVSKGIQWTTGGTFTAAAPEILFPSDTGGFITGGTSATVGRAITVSGGPSTVGQSNAASGGLVFDMGNSTGNATEAINFKGPLTGSNGTGTNTSISLVQLLNTGNLTWQSGLGASNFHITGPSDQPFLIHAGGSNTVLLSGGSGSGECRLQGAPISFYYNGSNSLNQDSPTTLSGVQAMNFRGGPGLGGNGFQVSLTGGAGDPSTSNSNAGGANVSTGASVGTGTSDINNQTSYMVGSGTTVQTLGDRHKIVGKTKTLSTTTATLTLFANIVVGTTLTGGHGTVYYSVKATSASDIDTATGHFDFTVVNKAGTLTVTAGTITDVKASTNGSITSGATVTASGTTCQLNVTPAFTTIVPTAVVLDWQIEWDGNPVTISVQ